MRNSSSWPSVRQVKLGLVLAAILAVAPAMAQQSSSATLTASTTVVQACAISNATLTFPNTSAASGEVTSETTISFTCSSGLAAKIFPGTNTAHVTANTYRMSASSGAGVEFSLFKDNNRSQPFASILGGDIDVTGSGVVATVNIYASIAPGAAAGASAEHHEATIPLYITYN